MSRSASSTPYEHAAARLPPPEKVTTTNSLSELDSTPGASTGAVSGTTWSSASSRVGRSIEQAANASAVTMAVVVRSRNVMLFEGQRREWLGPTRIVRGDVAEAGAIG